MSHLINTLLDQATYYLSGTLFTALLLGTGLFFTLYLRLPQVRYFRRACRLLLGRERSEHGAGDASVWQAMATSLASSIGAGSIAGVAMAIHIGGPSSVFWMWVNALLGMATRMAETAGSHFYRAQGEGGAMVGGPMYSMQRGLKMPWLGGVFAVGTLVTSFFAGNLPQVHGMTTMLHVQWGIDRAWAGFAIMCLVGMVVIGGIKRIGQVTEWLVPLMTCVYLALVLFVVGRAYDQILPALQQMFLHPFRTAPMVGGFFGAHFAQTMQQGLNYGFFTNDAGMGAASIVHCASKEQATGKVAMISMLEPFISTCLMCTLTALAIVATGSFATKVSHDLARIDIQIVAGHHENTKRLRAHVLGQARLPLFTGEIVVENGKVQNEDVTLLHDACVAEDVLLTERGKRFEGIINVREGVLVGLNQDVVIQGKSVLKGADLVRYTFSDNPWEALTTFLMILCFLLFAFSTIISYSYFGDRALVYLGGTRYIIAYRVLFVAGVFLGGTIEATIVWKAALLSCAMMAIPNLISVVKMRKEIKASVEAVR